MFSLFDDGTIRISRGDDSPKIPLFLNQGSKYQPIRYPMPIDTDCEVYFYVTKPHDSIENAVIFKTFQANAETVNSNNDIEIWLDSEDTIDMQPGKYFYQLRAKVITGFDSNNEPIYKVNTVTNKLPFYILDDDVDRFFQ